MAERGSRTAAARRTRAQAVPPPEPAPARPLRGLLPEVDAGGCEALRAFFAKRRWWLLGDGAAIQARAGIAPPAAFAIDAEGTRLWLHVDGPATSGTDAARLRWSDHAGRSRVLAWALAHEATLRRLSEWLGVSLLPALDGAGEVPGEANGVATSWLEVRIDDPLPDDAGDEAATAAPPTLARLQLPLAWLPALGARAEPPHEDDPPPSAGRWRALRASVQVLFPVTLAMRDWRALREGDVIVAGHRSQPPACVARASGRDWPLAPAPGGWTVRSASIPAPDYQEDIPMTQEHDGAESPEAAAAPDPARALPVQVEFELGRTEMSIGELADMQPGYVFPLATPLEGASVTIRANGRVAGRGELVAVGETLGVRLLSWS